jgi:hypothetical protein
LVSEWALWSVMEKAILWVALSVRGWDRVWVQEKEEQ